MKILRIILISLISACVIFGSYKASKSIIENLNYRYVPKNPVVEKKIVNDQSYKENQDVNKMIFHGVNGSSGTILPVKYDKKFIIYENKIYVTSNKGKTWMLIPDDKELGYAQISDYKNNFSESNISILNKKVSIVYGGRGSENISIISTDDEGKIWGVNSIDKTATHDLQNGYDKMYIDFLDDGRTGYIAAVRNADKANEEIFAFRSVNTGVTWDKADKNDTFYKKIIAHFGI